METAFQQGAFQENGFQIAIGAAALFPDISGKKLLLQAVARGLLMESAGRNLSAGDSNMGIVMNPTGRTGRISKVDRTDQL